MAGYQSPQNLLYADALARRRQQSQLLRMQNQQFMFQQRQAQAAQAAKLRNQQQSNLSQQNADERQLQWFQEHTPWGFGADDTTQQAAGGAAPAATHTPMSSVNMTTGQATAAPSFDPTALPDIWNADWAGGGAAPIRSANLMTGQFAGPTVHSGFNQPIAAAPAADPTLGNTPPQFGIFPFGPMPGAQDAGVGAVPPAAPVGMWRGEQPINPQDLQLSDTGAGAATGGAAVDPDTGDPSGGGIQDAGTATGNFGGGLAGADAGQGGELAIPPTDGSVPSGSVTGNFGGGLYGAPPTPENIANTQQALTANQAAITAPAQAEQKQLMTAIYRGDPFAMQEGLRRGLLKFSPAQQAQIKELQESMSKADSDSTLTPAERAHARLLIAQKLHSIQPMEVPPEQQPVDPVTAMQSKIVTFPDPVTGKPMRAVYDRSGRPVEFVTEREKNQIKAETTAQEEKIKYYAAHGLDQNGKPFMDATGKALPAAKAEKPKTPREAIANNPVAFSTLYRQAKRDLMEEYTNGTRPSLPQDSEIVSEIDRRLTLQEQMMHGGNQATAAIQPATPPPATSAPVTQPAQQPIPTAQTPSSAFTPGFYTINNSDRTDGWFTNGTRFKAEPSEYTVNGEPSTKITFDDGRSADYPNSELSKVMGDAKMESPEQDGTQLPHPNTIEEALKLPPGTRFVRPDNGKIVVRPHPTSKAERDALKPGTIYLAPDGSQRMR